MKLRSRSSRATGPKMRVPRGFKSLSMMTIALLSKRRSEPSSRLIGCLRPHQNRAHDFAFLHRAGRAGLFHVRGDDIADAGALRGPLPITPIIVAMRAPLLSATSSLDLR